MRPVERAVSAMAVVCVAMALLFGSAGEVSAQPQPRRTVHVIVALCDNVHQGIVPVPARIGNGDDPDNNLYWGAAFGVRTFFSRSQDWKLAERRRDVSPVVMERLVFMHRTAPVTLVADAYRGAEIKKGISDFFDEAAGRTKDPADLVTFVGHDGLMDFNLDAYPIGTAAAGRARETIILACASKQFFGQPLKQTGASPLLWTTGLMAPEAYTLKAALDGWIARESGEAIRNRAADAYQQYQKCGLKAARRLFATGW
jgi:hypothetical protein